VQRYLAARERAAGIVIDVGWVNGLGAIRCLGRAGIPVLALDHRGGTPLGFRSRYCLGLRCPDPLAEEERFIECMLALGGALNAAAPLYPTHDEGLNALARHRDVLGDRFLYPFPSWEALQRIQDKRYQIEMAIKAGVPVPKTVYPQSAAGARVAAEEIGFPVLVKPADNVEFKRRYRRQAFRCRTPAEVDEWYGNAEPFEPMVQEWIPGGDDELYTLGSYVAPDGRALGVFCGRKLRQTRNDNMGSCRVGEAVWVDAVVESGLALLRAVGFHGISQVELKRDPRDGAFKLIEINPRLYQWHGLASSCGVDLPVIAYRDLQGLDQPQTAMSGARKRWSITLMADNSPALVRPPYVDGVFALDDPRPGVVQVARFVQRAFS
jgi:predicted ATP-grasp superfamily ATP-dependent carboligase